MREQTELDTVLQWIDTHRDEAIADLQRYCQQPSIAAQNQGMIEMAAMVKAGLEDLNAQILEVKTPQFPVLVGRLNGHGSRRLAIYNHYDVQPPEPLEEWTSPPFAAEIRDGKLFARGCADNKGNLVARMWAVRAWQHAARNLPCSVTFLFEGEEEIGSPSLAGFATEHTDLIQADGCLWETGYRNDDEAPYIYAGVKGLLYVELRVRTVAYDLHSSMAPIAPNAAWRLLEALESLRKPDGQVKIPHFYDAVRQPTEAERELMHRHPIDLVGLKKRLQTDRLLGQKDQPGTMTEHLLFSPTCNICGIESGYNGPGSKTVLPATAKAKLDFRLVSDQDPNEILTHLKAYLLEQGFDDIEVVVMEGSELPAQSPIETPLVGALARSARTVYNADPAIYPRIEGTGPMEQLCQRHGLAAVGGAGIGYSDSRIHAPNENIRVDDFILGIKHVAALLSEFSDSQNETAR